MRVVCIDDSKRPEKIPDSQWVKKGETYTVIKAVKMGIQANTLGFELEELNLSGCFPYEYYDAKRFVPEEFANLENAAENIVEEELSLV